VVSNILFEFADQIADTRSINHEWGFPETLGKTHYPKLGSEALFSYGRLRKDETGSYHQYWETLQGGQLKILVTSALGLGTSFHEIQEPDQDEPENPCHRVVSVWNSLSRRTTSQAKDGTSLGWDEVEVRLEDLRRCGSTDQRALDRRDLRAGQWHCARAQARCQSLRWVAVEVVDEPPSPGRLN
jgi:hypothetical protein